MDYYFEIPPMSQALGKNLESTWWGDFRVGAEVGGLKGIRDTYKRGLELAKSDRLYGTEFSLALNWLGWFYYDIENQKRYADAKEKAELFFELWQEFHEWVLDHWEGDDLWYYIRETD